MNGQSSNYGGSTSTPGNSATTALPPVDPAQLLQAFATMQQFTNVMNMSGVQFPWPGAMPQLPAMPALPQLNMQPFQDPSLNQPMAPENDDKILISQLVEYRKRDGSYREALDTLHGRNNHSASMWKDYYLDHKHRLDARVERRMSQEPKASGSRQTIKREESHVPSLKKPSPSSFIVDTSPPHRPAPPKAPKPIIKKETKQKKVSSSSPFDAPTGARKTLNSLTAPTPAFNKKIPAPHTAITIPDPPSRSPTPPTKIIPRAHLKGNHYTDEDREYFIKFIGWRLKQDPTLTRHEISEMLGQKAPHHSANSWASFWSNNHDLPDKILATYRDNPTASVAGTSGVSTAHRRPNYRDRSTSNESAESRDSEYHADVKEEESDDDDDEALKEYSESEMGKAGERVTEADRYMMAKHVASFPQFSLLRNQDQWEPFAEKHPQRAWKSWNHYYRSHQKELDKLAKRISAQESEASSSSGELSDQVVRPTRPPIKGLKRKAEESESESMSITSSVSKRGRTGE